ncbi:hypothetical protein AB5I41_26475 [Sphingomonas sp. MMS24-JH45]
MQDSEGQGFGRHPLHLQSMDGTGIIPPELRMSGRIARRAACATAGAWLLPIAAAAQTAGAPVTSSAQEGPQPAGQPDRVTGRRTYEAVWFAPFAPATALQMERVPGFTIERIDESVRGFAQAAERRRQRQRPSAKSDDVETILRRIPASRVVRIEVGTGEQFGAEFAAKPQVLNVVTTQAGGMASTWRIVPVQLHRRDPARGAPLDAAEARTVDLQLGAQRRQQHQRRGRLRPRHRAAERGGSTEFRRKHNHIRDPLATLSGSWGFDDGPNRTAHLNGRVARGRFALGWLNRVTRPGGFTRDDSLAQRRTLEEFEIGGASPGRWRAG